MNFVTKSFRKDETLTSLPLLKHICPHFWTWLLDTIAITPKSEDKYAVKVFNLSEFHLSEIPCYMSKVWWSVFIWLQNPYFNENFTTLPSEWFSKVIWRDSCWLISYKSFSPGYYHLFSLDHLFSQINF